ncbi:MAG: PAS domain-containing protein [Spirochaetales bacterium]|nr:PAS domain-containing protein [Spirochaetales bacterium]
MTPYNDDMNKKDTKEQLLQKITRLRKNFLLNGGEEKYNHLSLTSRGNGIITTDCNGRIVTMNKIASEMTGWQPGRASGRPVDDVLSLVRRKDNQDHHVSLKQHVIELINKKVIKIAILSGCIQIKNGQEKEIEYTACPIMNEKGAITGIIFILYANPEYMEKERNPAESVKLNALALLAGGIAHDYNNILTIISGNIAVARTCECIDNELLNIFTETEIALKRAKDLTESLRILSKGSKPEKKPVNIEKLIKETVQIMLSESPVTCSYSFQHDPWPLEADNIQIERVIQNLILNAKEEFTAGGTIKIHVSNVYVKENEIHDIREGYYIKIIVSDNGEGIPEKHLQRIFEPYFTTKPGASGLGLTTAIAIINRHKGTITVESREGNGTTFTIFLPANIPV